MSEGWGICSSRLALCLGSECYWLFTTHIFCTFYMMEVRIGPPALPVDVQCCALACSLQKVYSCFKIGLITILILVGLNCFCCIARIWLFFSIQVFITTKVVSVNESAPEPEVTEEVVTFVQAEKRHFEPQDIQFILDDSQDDLDANVRLVREPVGVVRRKSGNKVKKRRSFREKFKRLSVG